MDKFPTPALVRFLGVHQDEEVWGQWGKLVIWATWLVGELYLEMHTRAISLAVSVSYWKLRMFSFDHIENLSK